MSGPSVYPGLLRWASASIAVPNVTQHPGHGLKGPARRVADRRGKMSLARALVSDHHQISLWLRRELLTDFQGFLAMRARWRIGPKSHLAKIAAQTLRLKDFWIIRRPPFHFDNFHRLRITFCVEFHDAVRAFWISRVVVHYH